MKQKTIEEKRAAVLAYCERVCPKIGDVWQDDLMGISIEHCEYTEGKSVFEFNVLGKSIIFRRDRNVFTDQINQFHYLAYRLLGLETADAVEAKKKAFRRLFTYQAKNWSARLDAANARNAALVKALEEIAAEKSALDADDRQISIDTLSVHWSAVHRIASQAQTEAEKEECAEILRQAWDGIPVGFDVPAPETPKTKWLQMSDDTAFEDGEWVCFRFGDQSLSMFQWRENGRWFYQIEAGTETILYRDHANKLNYIRISPEV